MVPAISGYHAGYKNIWKQLSHKQVLEFNEVVNFMTSGLVRGAISIGMPNDLVTRSVSNAPPTFRIPLAKLTVR
jgi:uncharacterized membrane protein YjjB (DUF3815 family)